jgi:hypothetical protein
MTAQIVSGIANKNSKNKDIETIQDSKEGMKIFASKKKLD